MKTKNIFFSVFILLFLLVSCKNEDDPKNNPSFIRFKSTISKAEDAYPNSRASNAIWSKNDAIGIYMIKSDGKIPGDILSENKRYITESESKAGYFTPANDNEAIAYPEDYSNVDFVAYYPYKESLIDHQYPIDISNQILPEDIDFLFSNDTKKMNRGNSDVPLQFNHMLSKIVFTISADESIDLSGLAIKIKGTKTKGSFDLAKSDLLADDNSVKDILANVSTDGKTAEAILIPEESDTEDRVFEFCLLSGKIFTLEIPTETMYKGGKKYTYEATLKLNEKGKVYVNINNATIKDWIEMPAESILPKEKEDPIHGKTEVDKLYGYAEGTTGGEGGKKYHFNDGKKFTEWLRLREKAKSTEPAIVWLSGTFTKEDGRDSSSPWFDIKDTKNISIYGTNGFKMQNVGFFLVRAENIIIRNVYIVMPKADNGADGVSMQNSSYVWVDHCTFESENQTKDYEDGSCDITHGSNMVTVSWNHFINTQKTCLVGHSDKETGDVGITATFHHNFFDQSSSRHPRVRYGTVHVYNNFYNQVTTYGVGSAYEAKVLVEGNCFDGVRLPTDICTFPAKKSGSSWVSNLTGTVAGFLYEKDNAFINKPADASVPYPFTNVEYKAYDGEKISPALSYSDFRPAYKYDEDPAENVSTIVRTWAGTGKLQNYDKAPIPVDNGGITGGNEEEEEEKYVDKVWRWKDIGDGEGKVGLTDDQTSLAIEGEGKLESKAQSFTYVYKEISGNFTMTAQLMFYNATNISNQSIAGLLLTPDVNATGNNFLFALSGKGGDGFINYAHRLALGSDTNKGRLSASTVGNNTYLKLKREGNKYYTSFSLDGGKTYSIDKSGTFDENLPDKLYIGFAVNSGSMDKWAVAIFGDITINGESIRFGN